MSESSVILLRIERLLQGLLERTAALHTDLAQLLAVLVQKTSNGAVVNPSSESDPP